LAAPLELSAAHKGSAAPRLRTTALMHEKRMRDNKIKDRHDGEGKNELLKNKSKSESESGRQTE